MYKVQLYIRSLCAVNLLCDNCVVEGRLGEKCLSLLFKGGDHEKQVEKHWSGQQGSPVTKYLQGTIVTAITEIRSKRGIGAQ